MKNKENIYLDLSKLSGEEIKEVYEMFPREMFGNVKMTNIHKYLHFDKKGHNNWFTSMFEQSKTEISLSEFRQLFSKREEVLQVENNSEIKLIEGILLGLNICKELWAQGVISHETIRENELHYQEELENLKSNN